MSLVRVLVTTQVTLTHVFFVDETPTDAAGSVTVDLKRLDGTVVDTDTAVHPGPPGQYTYLLPAQADLDSLTLDWSGTVGGAPVIVRDYVEIVGGFLFSIGDARTQLNLDANTYDTALLAAKRTEIEQEFEAICRQAFVPRFHREVVSGRDNAQLPTAWPLLRAVRAVSVNGVALAGTDLTGLGFSDHGVIKRPGGALWPDGLRNIIPEYEHGWDYPPGEVSSAGILRLRARLSQTSSAIPDRAISFTVAEGGVYRLSTPSRQRTGQPDVDGVLERYTRARRAVFA
jgi:hypothetical protein